MAIERFHGEYEFLSNFYDLRPHGFFVYHNAIAFWTTEHAFQAAKSLSEEDHRHVAGLDKPGKAKYWGRRYAKLRADWDEPTGLEQLITARNTKERVMLMLLRQKFTQIDLNEKLLATGDTPLIEGNWWHDNYWGDCQCKECAHIPGQNRLGALLMQVRAEMRAAKAFI